MNQYINKFILLFKVILYKFSLNLKVDVVISLGPACRPVFYIKKAKLRKEAFPFDWFSGFTLDDFITLTENNFEKFFTDVIDNTENKLKTHSDIKHRQLAEKNSNINSFHHFPLELTAEEYYPEFIAKIRKRNKRMHERIKASKKILFITNRDEPFEHFVKFLKRMQERFPGKEFVFLNIRNSENKYKKIIDISKTLKIIECGFKDVHEDGSGSKNPNRWMGNRQEWKAIVYSISLTN